MRAAAIVLLLSLTTASHAPAASVDSFQYYRDVKATNVKLHNRAIRIVAQATGASQAECETALAATDRHCKSAILMILLKVPADQAIEKLKEVDGHLRAALGGSEF